MMKIYLTAILVLLLFQLQAQKVTVTPNGITPAPVLSMLYLDYDDILALPSPKKGDIVYDITFNATRIYGKNGWVPIYMDPKSKQYNIIGIASVGDIRDDDGRGIGVDHAGNIYLLSNWWNSTFYGGGDSDIVISKYDSKGNEKWFIVMGGKGNDLGLDLVVDADGNTYITGFFETSITFSGKNGNVIKTAVGAKDFFVVKYNTNGAIQWVQTAGGTDEDKSRSLAIDNFGNVYVTGYFKGTANFGFIQKTSSGGQDMFVVKYNSQGTMQWVQAKEGSGIGEYIAVNNNGDVYIAGVPMLVKYNNYGVFQWERSLPILYVGGIGVDGSGNVYLGAEFKGEINIDNLFFAVADGNETDILVAKYNSDGELQRLTSNFSASNDELWDMAVDPEGNVYMTGCANGVFRFANIEYGTGFYSFIGKLDVDGNFETVHPIKHHWDFGIRSFGITISRKKQVYATGNYAYTINIGQKSYTAKGGRDTYIVLSYF